MIPVVLFVALATGTPDEAALRGRVADADGSTLGVPPPKPLLGLTQQPGQRPKLARLDPLTLAPLSPEVVIEEYHHAWSFSPDRAQLALAISSPRPTSGAGRAGIRIVDLERMAVRHDVGTRIAAEVLGWLTPRRLVAGLLDGDVVVVDTEGGGVLHRRRLPLRLDAHLPPQPAAPTASGLVILLNRLDEATATQVALADAEGGLRTLSLELGRPGERLGLAVDPAQQRAFVVSAGGPVADVDLKTMSAKYHHLEEPLSLGPRCPAARTGGVAEVDCPGARHALWLGGGKLAVFGSDYRMGPDTRPTRIPAGVAVLDTEKWTGFKVDDASRALLADDRLLVFGGRGAGVVTGIGLRAYSLNGRLLFHLFGSESIDDVSLAGGYAYAGNESGVRIVDPRSGQVVRHLVLPLRWFELLPSAP